MALQQETPRPTAPQESTIKDVWDVIRVSAADIHRKTLKFTTSGLPDFIAFENSMFWPLPRGKWVAFERMAAAAYRLPPAILSMYGPIVRAL